MFSSGPVCRGFSTPMKRRPLSRTSARALLFLDDPPAANLSPDPKDNPILAAAIAGKANLIVSGDKKHMLALGTVEGVPVVTAREALDSNPKPYK